MVIHHDNLAEVAEALAASKTFAVQGTGSKPGCPEPGGLLLSTPGLDRLLTISPEDQTAEVESGVLTSDLQSELALHGQCLPLVRDLPGLFGGVWGTVGGCLSCNLIHALEAQHGTWRDWVLGMDVMLASGKVARLGARTVKNVAGYDLHKVVVSSYGTLAVVLRVTMRTLPLQALAPSRLEVLSGAPVVAVLRTMRSDFSEISTELAPTTVARDPASSTLWLSAQPTRLARESFCLDLASRKPARDQAQIQKVFFAAQRD